jgi:hypothetical protein
MKGEKNLELVPVTHVQKAIVESLYIPLAFRNTIKVSSDLVEAVTTKEKLNINLEVSKNNNAAL